MVAAECGCEGIFVVVADAAGGVDPAEALAWTPPRSGCSRPEKRRFGVTRRPQARRI